MNYTKKQVFSLIFFVKKYGPTFVPFTAHFKNKIDNMKREKKLGAPATKPAQTTSVPPKSKPITSEISQD